MKVPSWLSWFGSKRAAKEPRGYFISTAGESQERLGRLGLQTGEEGILDRGKLVIPEGESLRMHADPELEWVIDIELARGREFAKPDLLKVFDREWRARNRGVWVYEEGRLQLGIGLAELESAVTEKRLTEIVRDVEEAMKKQRLTVVLREAEPVELAVKKAERLRTIRNEWGLDLIVVLKGPSDYSGMRVWQVLTDAGLQWGDGDLFHWGNDNRYYGDNQLFSVWTTSQPGYFFPEAIKAGKHDFCDLVFGYWIARSADALGVYDAMVKTIEYCQGRLGGVMLDRDGAQFDVEKGRAEVLRVVEGLAANGIAPGSRLALRIFK